MKSVHELSAEELAELKHNYFYGEERTFEELRGYDYPDEIPNKIIFDYYAGTSFVEEDFFCNITDDEEPLFMCNCCHELLPREEMNFDVDDDQDLCKNCNYQTYNEAPYGQD